MDDGCIGESVKRYISSKQKDGMFVIEGQENRHLYGVMRMRAGDEAVVFFEGSAYRCQIASAGRETSYLRPVAEDAALKPPKIQITLFQAYLKGDKTEGVVRACSELGLARVVPFVSRHTVVRPDAGKFGRLIKVAVESSKQCGRAEPLSVGGIADFDAVVQAIPSYGCVIFPYELEKSRPFAAALEGIDKIDMRGVAVIIGSEGGFTADEARALTRVGAISVTLGPRILKADTAAVAVCAAVMFAAGEWEP